MLILRNGERTTILKRHKHGSRRQPALQNLSTQRSDRLTATTLTRHTRKHSAQRDDTTGNWIQLKAKPWSAQGNFPAIVNAPWPAPTFDVFFYSPAPLYRNARTKKTVTGVTAAHGHRERETL